MQSPQAATEHTPVDLPERDVYWLAGLLEGEGSFLKGPPSAPYSPIVRLTMTDRDVVEMVGRMFERAVTRSDREVEAGHKTAFITVLKGAEAAQLMRTLLPVMGRRRRAQIRAALAVPHLTRIRWRGSATCTADRCEERVRARGLCLRHYRSWWKAQRFARHPKVHPSDAPGPPAIVGLDGQLAVPAADTRDALSWLAGLLEGEGSFWVSAGYPRISAQMCDVDVLTRAAQILGSAPPSPKDVIRNEQHGWTPSFAIGISGSRAAEVARQLRPLMGIRRQYEIERSLATYRPVRLVRPPATCLVEGCTRPHRSRGLCHKHYMEWWRDARSGRIQRVIPAR